MKAPFIALTRPPSADLVHCQLTFVERQAIDFERACFEHREYCEALRAAGAKIIELDQLDGFPDAVFVEDTAVVLDEVGVLAVMGTPSRALEITSSEDVLRSFRELATIAPPATLEGGDVLRVGGKLFVGLSRRTNSAGAEALAGIAESHGYVVETLNVGACLHLKTAVTALDAETVLLNPEWVSAAAFSDYRVLAVDPREPFAANTLSLAETLMASRSAPRTNDYLRSAGHTVVEIDLVEFEKAEAGLTCLSLIFEADV